MTIKELKEIIANIPDHMDVFIRQENDEYNLSMVESALVIEATFKEDSGPLRAKDNIFLITDDNSF